MSWSSGCFQGAPDNFKNMINWRPKYRQSGAISMESGKPADISTGNNTSPARERASSRQIDGHVVSITDSRSYDAEQYRKLRHVLEEKKTANGALVVAICSPAAGDGKSLTAVNLAATLAQASTARVLLLDVDLRRESASIRELLGLDNNTGPGISDAIAKPASRLQDVARRTHAPNFSVVLTGGLTSAPYELLRSAAFDRLLREARSVYDYIVIDAPPVVPVSDCRVIASRVDAFLMVVAANRTPRGMLEEALNLMAPEKVLGLIFNRCDMIPSRYYGYYGYYSHYYGDSTGHGFHRDSKKLRSSKT